METYDCPCKHKKTSTVENDSFQSMDTIELKKSFSEFDKTPFSNLERLSVRRQRAPRKNTIFDELKLNNITPTPKPVIVPPPKQSIPPTPIPRPKPRARPPRKFTVPEKYTSSGGSMGDTETLVIVIIVIALICVILYMFYKKRGEFSKVSGGKVMYLKQPNKCANTVQAIQPQTNVANSDDIHLIPLEDGADQPLF